MTGVTGFAGQSVAEYFLQHGYQVVSAGRRPPVDENIEFRLVPSQNGQTNWQDALDGVEVVVHLAGRAHQMHESEADKSLYFEINCEGTINLAERAARAGVKKFVFISSIKAMLSDANEDPLNEEFECRPVEPYGMSKLQAEIELKRVAQNTGMKVVILRPPLIYGPGVKGNLASLILLLRRFPILPLGGLTNRRSLLGVRNLASAIEAVIVSEAADGKTFLVSDGEEISTSELVRRLAVVYNPSFINFALPAWLWEIAGRLPILAPKVARLTGSLPVDASLLTRETGWKAPFSMAEQL